MRWIAARAEVGQPTACAASTTLADHDWGLSVLQSVTRVDSVASSAFAGRLERLDGAITRVGNTAALDQKNQD